MSEPGHPFWLNETTDPTVGQRLLVDRVICDVRTRYQHLRIVENLVFGRVLVLDGAVQATERDERCYHEMLVLPALLAHGGVRRALVLGGGDGGCLKQLMADPVIESVDLVEIDPEVVALCGAAMPGLSDGAFHDPRLTVHCEDGAAFVRRGEGAYDLIVVDAPDPRAEGPSAALHAAVFHDHARNRCAAGGVLVAQCGTPFLQPETLAGTVRQLRRHWRHVAVYLGDIPSYHGGALAFAVASDAVRPLDVGVVELEARLRRLRRGTLHYTPQLHHAAFVLPRWLDAAVHAAGSDVAPAGIEPIDGAPTGTVRTAAATPNPAGTDPARMAAETMQTAPGEVVPRATVPPGIAPGESAPGAEYAGFGRR